MTRCEGIGCRSRIPAGPIVDLPAQSESQRPWIPTVAQVRSRFFKLLHKKTAGSRQSLAEGNRVSTLLRLHAVDRRVRKTEYPRCDSSNCGPWHFDVTGSCCEPKKRGRTKADAKRGDHQQCCCLQTPIHACSEQPAGNPQQCGENRHGEHADNPASDIHGIGDHGRMRNARPATNSAIPGRYPTRALPEGSTCFTCLLSSGRITAAGLKPWFL